MYNLLENCPHAAFVDGEFIDQLENEEAIDRFKEHYEGYDVKIYTRREICEWRRVDEGMMGFHDYEWKTSCGERLDCDSTNYDKYCTHCGKEIKII